MVLRIRNRTIIDLLGNIFIHIAARSKLSLQMAETVQRANNITQYCIAALIPKPGHIDVCPRGVNQWQYTEAKTTESENIFYYKR